MTLTEYQYIWALTCISSDDGHRVTMAHFSDRKDAENARTNHCGGREPAVIQMTLWKGSDGKWYDLSPREVFVDRSVHRTRAMQKLTEEEIRALGVSR